MILIKHRGGGGDEHILGKEKGTKMLQKQKLEGGPE